MALVRTHPFQHHLTSTHIHQRRQVRLLSVPCRVVPDYISSHFFSVVGSAIKIHSATSGKIISTLPGSPDEGHTDIITSVVLSPQNAFQLITASLDGTIKIWDFLEGVLLQTIGLDQPIHHVCTHEKIKDHLFVAAIKNKKSKSARESCPGSFNDSYSSSLHKTHHGPVTPTLFRSRVA